MRKKTYLLAPICILIVQLYAWEVSAQTHDAEREQAIILALLEAGSWWSSAPTAEMRLDNIFNPRYHDSRVGCVGPSNSTYIDKFDYDADGYPLFKSLQGSPYGFGCNDRMWTNSGVSNASYQSDLDAGHGIGAHSWHFDCDTGTDQFAVGIDCSELTVQVIWGYTDWNTGQLWDNSVDVSDLALKQADLRLRIAGSDHTRIFYRWNLYPFFYDAIESCSATDKVSVTSAHTISDGYSSRRPDIWQVQTAISDIGGFWLEYIQFIFGTLEARFSYVIQHTAEPDDSAAVYISDNSAGPARLIRVSAVIPDIDDPPGSGIVNHWSDRYRPNGYDDDYYYFLNHETGPFPEVLPPGALFGTVIPVTFNWGLGTGRPVLDPPEVVLDDEPLDDGSSILVQWTLSDDDAIIDCYNIYRRDSTAGSPPSEFKYVTSVDPGTESFKNDLIPLPQTHFSYKVSAAHHGTGGAPNPDTGVFALWNDFSISSNWLRPVHNFAQVTLSLLSLDTLLVSPDAGEDTLLVSVNVLGSDGLATVGAPLGLILTADSVYTCAGDTVLADSLTGIDGTTTFTIAHMGGHGAGEFRVAAMGTNFLFGTVDIFVRSPDGNADGSVDLIDLSEFVTTYNLNCGDAGYLSKWDLTFDCRVDLADLAALSAHYPAGCP